MNNFLTENEISPYPQPMDGVDSCFVDNAQEIVGYLSGTNCRIWYTHLSTSFPEHWHIAMEIISGEKGSYISEIDGTTYEIHCDDILLIPPGLIHTLSPQNGCNGFVCLIDVSVLHEIKSAVTIFSVLAAPIIITKNNNPKLHIAASTILKQMQKEYFSNKTMRELTVYAHLLMLMAEIGNNSLESTRKLPNMRKELSDKFNEIQYYINQHYMDAVTIDQLSKQFGFSKYYFARLFKQYIGFTFCDYLTHQRIKAAEYLLSQQDVPITDIAYKSGFSSISTFSRVFKQRKNCTPSEYRKIFER